MVQKISFTHGLRWAAALLIIFLLVVRINTVSPLLFDAGWLAALARNWVEFGHYGQFLLGEPVASTMLNTGFPAVIPVALSFRLFGVGIWQAKIAGILFTMGILVVFYGMTRALYNQKTADAALVIVLLLPMYEHLHPILMGRKPQGEVPALFFLLVGYWLLLKTWNSPWHTRLWPAVVLALALRSKPQTFPFLLAAFTLSTLALYGLKCRPSAQKMLFCLLGILAFNQLFMVLWELFVQPYTLSAALSADPYDVLSNIEYLFTYVIALNLKVRAGALAQVFLLVGAAAWPGLVWMGRHFAQNRRKIDWRSGVDVVKLNLWIFCASWFAWYFCLSIAWPRYLFPAAVMGSVFTAGLWQEITGDFDLRGAINRSVSELKSRQFTGKNICFNLVLVFFCIQTLTTARTLFQTYTSGNQALVEVTDFINTQTPPDALIETSESELFFLLQRPYHYPPDRAMHFAARVFLEREMDFIYDLTPIDPDYIVVGWAQSMGHLYDEILATGQFDRVYENERYEVYQKTTDLE